MRVQTDAKTLARIMVPGDNGRCVLWGTETDGAGEWVLAPMYTEGK
jgi:hypothetical protein